MVCAPAVRPTLRELDEAGVNAWPSLEQVIVDGWLLRSAVGYTRRSNSVQPLYEGSRSLYAKILTAERWYRERHLPAMFRVTVESRPDGLDGVLADRGYTREAPTSVQWLPLAEAYGSSTECDVWTDAETDWFNAHVQIQGMDAGSATILRRLLNIGGRGRTFGLVCDDAGEPASVGMAVREGSLVGLFGLGTAPEKRGRGFGTRLIAGLLESARAAGAEQAYLQVGLSNDPALSLYAGLGFREVYRYWYRRACSP